MSVQVVCVRGETDNVRLRQTDRQAQTEAKIRGRETLTDRNGGGGGGGVSRHTQRQNDGERGVVEGGSK